MEYNKSLHYTYSEVCGIANKYTYENSTKLGEARTRLKVFDKSFGNLYGYEFELVEQKGVVHDYHWDDDNQWKTVGKVVDSTEVKDINSKNVFGKPGAYIQVFSKSSVMAIMKRLTV